MDSFREAGLYHITDSLENDEVFLSTYLRTTVLYFCKRSIETRQHDLSCCDIHRNGRSLNLMSWYEAYVFDNCPREQGD